MVVPLRAGVVEADDLDGLALAAVLGRDRVQGGDGGGVPDVGVGQVDDDVRRGAGIVELVDEVVAGGEEQLTVDGIDASFLVRVGHVDDLDEVRHAPGEHHHRHQDTDHDPDGEVMGQDGDGDSREHHDV